MRDFWIEVRKVLNSDKLLTRDMHLCSQNIGSKCVTRKIFWNNDLAAGSGRPTSGVDASWNESRPRMGTLWLFSRARVKCRCHRNLAFVCGKLPNQGKRKLWARRRAKRKSPDLGSRSAQASKITKSGPASPMLRHF